MMLNTVIRDIQKFNTKACIINKCPQLFIMQASVLNLPFIIENNMLAILQVVVIYFSFLCKKNTVLVNCIAEITWTSKV